ncbi:MAG: hypothetical protein S4CHLAM7_13960 [Chlamydiae bacterium]|nr:hypothetical protein [Chlamydiota bacterium]
MKYLFTTAIAFLTVTLSAAPSWGNLNMSKMDKPDQPSRIIVDNRVLANVNNHPISVIDVMKKMDTYFYKEYPHLIDSEIARYQFYKGNWNYVFDDMINNELICSDAKNRKVEVTNGDVRQELDRLFGPQIITNLDKIGLSYDEAWQMTQKDIYVRRMMSSILYLKGVYNTTPVDLLSAFDDYTQKNKKPDLWMYHILSFRGPNAYENSQMAKQLLEEFNKEGKDFDTLALLFKERVDNLDAKEISISDKFQLKDSEISQNHKQILENLPLHSFSDAVEEMSRVDKKPLYRLFYLAQYIPGGKIEFAEVEDKLKEALIQSKVDVEISSYITGLRERFGVTKESLDEILPSNFEPFSIK